MMSWQGFALVLFGAFFHVLYNVLNKKLLVKEAPANCAAACASSVDGKRSPLLCAGASAFQKQRGADCASCRRVRRGGG